MDDLRYAPIRMGAGQKTRRSDDEMPLPRWAEEQCQWAVPISGLTNMLLIAPLLTPPLHWWMNRKQKDYEGGKTLNLDDHAVQRPQGPA